jgi:hypothetical protein
MNATTNTVNFLFHEKEVNSKGQRRTFAATVNNNTMSIGISICGPKDNFNKKLGRVIATGRANKKPSKTITITNNNDLRDIFFNAVKTL